jgi:hypothetical protein
MLNLFKKENIQNTFKERVSKFWEEFSRVENQLMLAIEEKNSTSISNIISNLIKILKIHISWTLTPQSKINKKLALTLSPEGNKHYALLALFWKNSAPNIENWEFHAAKTANPKFNSMTFDIYGKKISLGDTLFSSVFNEETKRFDIVIFNPEFKNLEEPHLSNFKYLLLDELLGESVVATLIGKVSIQLNGDQMVNYQVLYDEINKNIQINGWEKDNLITSIWTSYQRIPTGNDKRNDIFVGSTIVPELNNLKNDPLRNSGAEYTYIYFEHSQVNKDNLISERTKISSRLVEILKNEKLGYLIGEATGVNNSYIDFILFDVDKGTEIIKTELAKIEDYNFNIRKFY